MSIHVEKLEQLRLIQSLDGKSKISSNAAEMQLPLIINAVCLYISIMLQWFTTLLIQREGALKDWFYNNVWLKKSVGKGKNRFNRSEPIHWPRDDQSPRRWRSLSLLGKSSRPKLRSLCRTSAADARLPELSTSGGFVPPPRALINCQNWLRLRTLYEQRGVKYPLLFWKTRGHNLSPQSHCIRYRSISSP